MDKVKKFFRPAVKTATVVILRWLILAIAAIALQWFLQYRTNGNNPEAAWNFWDTKPAVFWYSALIIFTILIIAYGVFYGPFRAISFIFALIVIISYINNTKFAFRGTPLLPEDFQLADQAGTLTSFIDVGELIRNIIAAVLAIGLGFLVDYLTSPYLYYLPKITLKSLKKKMKTKKAKLARKKRIWVKIISVVAPRIIIIPVGIFLFLFVSSSIVHHDSGPSQQYEWLDNTELVAWNQNLNYEQNGFLLGFLYNIGKASLEEPKGYSESKIAEIKNYYKKESNKEPNSKRQSLKDADYNIVVILNESFYDASLIQQHYDYEGVDPLQTFHGLMKEFPAGYMYSPDYGGGTANIEFEADTGLSNFWAKTVPYTDILPKINSTISIAKEAKAAGYKTTAIHSFSGGMYKRDYALPKEGFDTFITQDEMHYKDTAGSTGGYISDRSIYNETLDVLNSSNEKQLIGVVTMQNHAPYYHHHYSDEEYEFEFNDETFDESTRNMILAYLQSVRYSDTFLAEFLDKLMDSDKKTVILFYGDHAPGIFTEFSKSSDKDLSNLVHLTPYFVWANFELDDTFSDKKYGEEFQKEFGVEASATLPTTTPNCLSNALYGVLNLKRNSEKMLLEKVCQEAPILTDVYLGKETPSSKSIEDYKLLNYDILGGKQYWLK